MNDSQGLRPKLDLIEAGGSHYEIGLALGRNAARAFHEVIPRIRRFRRLKNDTEALLALERLESGARDTFPELMREVDGIADGAGADFRDVWLWNCRGDFAGGRDQSQPALEGCTTVLIPGADGIPGIIGHNEDDQPELDGCCCLARIVPDDAPAFVSFYSPGLLPGHTFAVNEAGLVQTINHVRPYDQRQGVPRHVIARAVLAQASLDDAVRLLERDDRASGFHHNLGMAGDDRLLSVEAPASGCAVEVVAAPRAHTNHLNSARFADIAQEVAASSRDRLHRAETLIAGGALEARDPLAILADSAGGGLPIFRKGAHPADPGYTLATAVFELDGSGVSWRVYSESTALPERIGRIALS